MESTLTNKKEIDRNLLKYIAIIAMLIDHIAWAFVPTLSLLGQSMHFIGRITAPIMCFFIAEGYYYTRDVKKYALRLGIFTVISAFAYTFEHTGSFFPLYSMGMIYTLLLGLLALIIWNKQNINIIFKILIILIFCMLSLIGDWSIFGVLFVLAFGLNRGNLKKQIMWFSISALVMIIYDMIYLIKLEYPWYREIFQLGLFLAVPLIYFYNGQKGKGGKFNKWIFYVFYPLHLIILGILQYYIFK